MAATKRARIYAVLLYARPTETGRILEVESKVFSVWSDRREAEAEAERLGKSRSPCRFRVAPWTLDDPGGAAWWK